MASTRTVCLLYRVCLMSRQHFKSYKLLLIITYHIYIGGRGSKTITATPRQLESLIRISQALTKMRLSEVVLCEDVLEATRLMRVATQTAATDPRTGMCAIIVTAVHMK